MTVYELIKSLEALTDAGKADATVLISDDKNLGHDIEAVVDTDGPVWLTPKDL